MFSSYKIPMTTSAIDPLMESEFKTRFQLPSLRKTTAAQPWTANPLDVVIEHLEKKSAWDRPLDFGGMTAGKPIGAWTPYEFGMAHPYASYEFGADRFNPYSLGYADALGRSCGSLESCSLPAYAGVRPQCNPGYNRPYSGLSWEFNRPFESANLGKTVPLSAGKWELEPFDRTVFSSNVKTVANGLALDRFKDLRVHSGIDDALDLLKQVRQTDKVFNAIVSGAHVNPETIAKAIQLDRTVDVRVANLIQNMLNYRRRNSEGNHILEHLLNGRTYQGPDVNPFSIQIRDVCLDVVKREIEQLYALSGRL